MAKSPVLLKSYVYLSEQVGNTDLTPLERQLVLMRVSRFQECRYCLADHTPYVETHGIDMGGINAIGDDQPIGSPKLATLGSVTLKLVEQRGVVSRQWYRRCAMVQPSCSALDRGITAA